MTLEKSLWKGGPWSEQYEVPSTSSVAHVPLRRRGLICLFELRSASNRNNLSLEVPDGCVELLLASLEHYAQSLLCLL